MLPLTPDVMNNFCSAPEELDDTVQYLAEHMKPFVKHGELAFICFPRSNSEALGSLLGKAVALCGGKCLFWEQDYRWRSLLESAFVSKCSIIIGPPLILLGLGKLSYHLGMPLSTSYAITSGYPCLEWIRKDIEQYLDCSAMSILGPGNGPIVSGFSCKEGNGIHIRSDKFSFKVLDEPDLDSLQGKASGRILFSLNEFSDYEYQTNFIGTLSKEPCRCGCGSPRILGLEMKKDSDMELYRISSELMKWNSILDCSVSKGNFGNEIEIVSFRGERLPLLPECSKLVIRYWIPEKDIPLTLNTRWISV